MSAGTLVVGASQAGLQLAVSLRQLGEEGPITLVGAEPHAPYQRPPLSKEFLVGTATRESLALRAARFYAEAGIDLVLGEHVTELTLPGGHGAGAATTASGRVLRFDRLALTVGASARRLAVPGAELPGICYLRSLEDADALKAGLPAATHVVVVGGGFIGLEAAAAARAYGKDVTVVEVADRLLARAVAPVVSEFYRQAHVRRGTNVLLSTAVEGFTEADGRVAGVRLGDGTVLPADLVVVGVGVVPATGLAEQVGLRCDGGIVVDDAGRTSDPAVVAAGDCTVQPHPMTDLGAVRLESVENAVTQASRAAAALLGQPAGRRAVPWFWSNQGDLRLQIAGVSTGYDDCVVRGEPQSEKFSVLYYRQGQLLACDAVNNPVDYMVVRKVLAQGGTIPPDRARDVSTPLKALLASGAAA